EGIDDPRIEVAAAPALDLFQRLAQTQGRPVDAVRHHRLEGVRHRDDARTQWDLFALEAFGITGSVPLFMVMTDQGSDMVEALDRADDVGAAPRMAAHPGHLV